MLEKPKKKYKATHKHDKKGTVIIRMITPFGERYSTANICSVCRKFTRVYEEEYDMTLRRYLTSDEILEKYKGCDVVPYKIWYKYAKRINKDE